MKMVEEYQMVIVGVGGQGILTISDVIAIAARKNINIRYKDDLKGHIIYEYIPQFG